MKLSKYTFLTILWIGILVFTTPNVMNAHPDKNLHAKEIASALGFQNHPEIHNWLCFISSDMIDKHEPFYTQLTQSFPRFKCKHRLLFHWNYNGKPWTPGLESRVKAYARQLYGLDRYEEKYPKLKEQFLNVLRTEQKRRNRIINKKTEELFGFASGGKDASYANFFASMAYDLHILGDYTSGDNTDLNGLVEFNSLIYGIISSIKKLDHVQSKSICNLIRNANQTNEDVQKRADRIMNIIQNHLPQFIKQAQGGSLKRRLEKRGDLFVS